jgi:HEAT repeat protein
MRRSVLATAVLALASSAVVLAIATITELTLADGRTDANTLATPVLDRAEIIDALALIGAPESVTPLADRLAREKDEDCRWYTIKALDYIDTDEARAAIKDKGLEDPDAAVSRLSIRSLGLVSK